MMGSVTPNTDPATSKSVKAASFFSSRELRTVVAFAQVFIEGQGEAISAEQIAANLDAHVADMHTKRTASLHLVLFVIEFVVPLLSFRGPFSRLDAVTRRRLIERFIAGPRAGRLLRNLAKIKTLFLLGYYGDPRVRKSIGFAPPPGQSRYRGIDLTSIQTPLPGLAHIPAGQKAIRCEICVIGSGAGGAVVAAEAAAAGRKVILVEEGRYVPAAAITHDEALMSAELYKESGLQSTVDLEMTILQGRALGGTTLINNAICFRLNDSALTPYADTLRVWDSLGAHVDSADLAASYTRVEEAIQARALPEVLLPGLPGIPAGSNGEVLLRGWNALAGKMPDAERFRTGLFRLNLNKCLACGYCNFGCPYGRRFSMLETYIPRAIEHGARILVESHAVKIETRDDRAVSVQCEMADGRTVTVAADVIVVACGAIGSSVLLMKSGVNKNVGTRFSFNAATPVLGLFPDRLDSFEGLQMASFIDAGDFVMESLFSPPMSFSFLVPGWFEAHFDRMKAYDKFAMAGVVVGTEPNGRVKRSSFFRDTFGPVGYHMTANDLSRMKRGLALLVQAYFAAGAESVFLSTFLESRMAADRFATSGHIRTKEIEEFIESIIKRPEDLTLNSAHPQGGNPMSDRPDIGVVDSSFKVHGFSNLYVADASVFPTSIRINPQLTIMAMADHAWHQHISKKG
ncbi:MAG TPA: GMC family oxidoreductase N-terminal domain-containing protein [Spirochaetia bacterium]|nr:GMC family oxidoreductase N-terminal domain-containing protein [Spirochaetia bacterium]